MLKVILIWWYMRSTARKLSTYLISLTCSISIYPLLTSTSSRQWSYCEITSQSLRQWWKKSSERTYIWRCRTFNVRHTEMTEHIESVAVLPNVLRSYYMCCFLIRCVADPIQGVCRSSYTLYDWPLTCWLSPVTSFRTQLSRTENDLYFPLVSGSPVHATAKRPQTGPIWTDLDRTASCRLHTFQIEGQQLQPVLTATGSTRRQPVRLEGSPSKYLPNEPKTIEKINIWPSN